MNGMQIMIDTNIVVSAVLYPESRLRTIVEYVVNNHTLVISAYSLEEIHRLFRSKFKTYENEVNEFFSRTEIQIFDTPRTIDSRTKNKIRDHKDIPVLESFILSDSSILITGDNDFFTPELVEYKILRPSEFYEQYLKSG